MASVNVSGSSTCALASTIAAQSTCDVFMENFNTSTNQCNLDLNAKAPDDESGPYKCIETKLPSKGMECDEAVGNFDCNICLDSCQEPVVTMCGHLFCWSCLYSWLSLHSCLKECPVCKANVHAKVIPLYGRGRVGSSAKKFPKVHIPCRPSARRSIHVTPHVVASDGGELANHGSNGGELTNHGIIRIGEVHTTDARRSIPSRTLLDCFASLVIGFRCPASVPPHTNATFVQWHQHSVPSSVVAQQRRRFNSEKEFVLHWAFIIVGLVATIGFLVYA